jgi:hypothetical protein
VKDNLAPPLLPHPIDWESMLPSRFKSDLLRDFPRLSLGWGELEIEEEAGMGLGVVVFAALFIFYGIRAGIMDRRLLAVRQHQAFVLMGAGAIAWLGYLSKIGSESTSRLVAAYYPLLIAGILVMVSLDGRVARGRLFKWVGALAMLSGLPLVILCPARPLFPAQAVSSFMAGSHLPAAIIERFDRVYSVYAARANAFRELTASVPQDEPVLGFLQDGNDPDAPLWRPFGTRKVIEVTPADSIGQIKARGLHFVIVGQDALTVRYQTTIASLAAKWSASIVEEKNITLLAHRGPETWYLLRL